MSTAMSTALANAVVAYALDFPEAWEDHPWGSTSIKVRKKVFMFSGLSEDEVFSFSVKLPHTGAEARQDQDNAEPTHYGMGKHGWVSFRYAPGEPHDLDRIKDQIQESYCAIAPKTLVKQRLAETA